MILQNGPVTPGHLAAFVTDNVLADGGVPAAAQKVLARISANFNTATDQPLVLPSRIIAFMLTGIIVTNSVIPLTIAVGGFYPQVSKAGTTLVAAGQTYATLTSANKLMLCTLQAAVATTRYSRNNLPDWAIYLSLTTPQGADATPDVYVMGVDLT